MITVGCTGADASWQYTSSNSYSRGAAYNHTSGVAWNNRDFQFALSMVSQWAAAAQCYVRGASIGERKVSVRRVLWINLIYEQGFSGAIALLQDNCLKILLMSVMLAGC